MTEWELKLWAANFVGERRDWSFGTFPDQRCFRLEMVKKWATAPLSSPPGLLLFGKAGTGKTGLAVCAARFRVMAGDGEEKWWSRSADPKILEACGRGELRRRPAPVFFQWWPSMVDRLSKSMQSSGDDDDRPTFDVLIEEVRQRVTLLVLDDVDVGHPTPFREMALLTLLGLADEGMRLVVTLNRQPGELVPVLGERVVDRLMGKRFLKVQFLGSSLRG